MAEQIYPLTFEGRESNPRMLGGSGVLNTPLNVCALIVLITSPIVWIQLVYCEVCTVHLVSRTILLY